MAAVRLMRMRLSPSIWCLVFPAILALSACDSLTGTEAVRLPTPLMTISAGGGHTCVTSPDGRAFCWGDNSDGQLGTGNRRDSSVPVEVSGGIDFVKITVGGEMRWPEYQRVGKLWAPHTCGLARNGDAFCWGSSTYQQLGDGTIPCVECSQPPAWEPRPVVGGPFKDISSGRGHTCAISLNEEILCWGRYAKVEWIVPTLEPAAGWNAPRPLNGGPHFFKSISVSDNHGCGVAPDGRVHCWGGNRWRQLGLETGDSEIPVPVPGESGFSSVYTGPGHTCALKDDGSAFCWGRNELGQLGSGEVNALCMYGLSNTRICETDPTGPRPVLQGSVRFSSLALGLLHTCGLTPDGEAFCWGGGESGQLGISEAQVITPEPVQTDLRFSTIAAGGGHTCGISVQGQAYCWGDGEFGQLGNGERQDAFLPVKVSGQSP